MHKQILPTPQAMLMVLYFHSLSGTFCNGGKPAHCQRKIIMSETQPAMQYIMVVEFHHDSTANLPEVMIALVCHPNQGPDFFIPVAIWLPLSNRRLAPIIVVAPT